MATKNFHVGLLVVASALATTMIAPSMASGAGVSIAASCDGTWHVLSTPAKKSHDTSFAAVDALSATDAWAVGQDSTARAQVPRVEHWDGAAWTTQQAKLPTGAQSGYFTGVSALSATDAWAVGAYTSSLGELLVLVERWNGTKWTLTSTGILGTNTEALAVKAIAPNDVWLVGRSGTTTVVTLTAHWNGSTWSAVPSPNKPGSDDNWLTAISASSPTDVWATGNWTSPSWSNGLAEHWNGTAWTIVSTKPAFNLTGVAAISATDAWTGGIDASGAGVVIQRWNGTKWVNVSAPAGSEAYVGGMGAAAADDVWLFGSTYGGQRTVFTEHWNGFAWAVIPAETPTSNAVNIGGMSVVADGSAAFGVATYWKTETSRSRTLAEMWC